MFARILCVLLAVSVGVTTLPPPADAQFGIRRAFKKVVRAPLKVLPRAGRLLPLVVIGGPFRSVFGVVAAVAVGAIIFDRLSKNERREVARRAKVVVAKDPEQRVADTYTSKDGTKQVTIVAEPMQRASDLKNDPAIIVTADKVVSPDGKGDPVKPGASLASDASTASDAQLPPGVPSAQANTQTNTAASAQTKDAPPSAQAKDAPSAQTKEAADAAPAQQPVDKDVVRISEIPPDTQCRKVTTELEIRKKKTDTEAEKNSNTAIFCQTAPGEWKPAAA